MVTFSRCVPALGALFAVFSTALARPPAGDAIAKQWAGRRQAVRVARFTLSWERFPTGLRPGDPRPGEDGAFTGTGVVLLDFAGGRLRVDQDELLHLANRRERISRVRTSLRYDGTEQFTTSRIDFDAAAAPPDPPADGVDVAPWERGNLWPVEFDPLLWAHGIPSAARYPDQYAVPFARTADGRFTPVGRELIDGRECVTLRDESAGEPTTAWADPGRGGVVIRRRTDHRGGGVSETAVTYRETPPGWFPSGWTESSAKPGQALIVTRRVRVESAVFDGPVSAEEFRVAGRPGMTVYKPGALYRVGADGGLTRVDWRAEAGLGPESFSGRIRQAVTGAGWGWGVSGIGATAALAAVLVRLRRRRPAAAAA